MSAGVYPIMPLTKTTISGATYATVGASSAIAVQANGARRWLVVTNTSANVIWLGLGVAAVVGSGIYLPAGAGYIFDHTNPWVGAVYAIASGAGSNLAITEV